MAEDKKISFGFSKLKAQPKLVAPIGKPAIKSNNSVQYIDFLENHSIKIKNEVIEEKKELVIPLKKNIVEVRKETEDVSIIIKQENKKDGVFSSESFAPDKAEHKNSITNVQIKSEETPEEEANSLEAQARRELLADLSKSTDAENQPKIFSLPLTSNAPKEGEKESTLDDYENIPIQEFGMAMLRGMGWKAEDVKNKSKIPDVVLRPKGLGLGAEKNAATNQKKMDGEDLKLNKGCFVKIMGGMYKNNYGKLESFNEDSGRIVIKLTLSNEHVTVNEPLVQRVTQSDYEKNSRVINIQKYEEYKDTDGTAQNYEKHDKREKLDSRYEEKRNEDYRSKYRDHNKEKVLFKSSNYENNSSCQSSSKHKYSSDESDHEKYRRQKIKSSKYEKSSRKNYSSDDDKHYKRDDKRKYSTLKSKKYSQSESDSDYGEEKYSKHTSKSKNTERQIEEMRKRKQDVYSRDRKKLRRSSSDREEERGKPNDNSSSSEFERSNKKRKKKKKKSKHQYDSSESDVDVGRTKSKHKKESKSREKKNRRKYSDSDSDERRN